MIALLCALLSGAMFYFSQGLDNVWALAWIAPLPLLWLAYGKAPTWQLFLAGVGAFAWGQVYVVQCYGGTIPTVVLAPLLTVLSVSFAAALLFARAAYRRLPPIAALIAFPALWSAFEYLFSLVSPNGSYGSLAYAEVSFPVAIQIASLFGLCAVTFALCLFANAVALLARGERAVGVAGIGVCALVLVFGFVRLAAPQGETVRVAALANPDSRRIANADGTFAAVLADTTTYAAVIRKLAPRGVRVFAIPEGAIPMLTAWQSKVLSPLSSAAKDTGALIVAGTIVPKPTMNRSFAFLPNGAERIYSKRHLLRPLETGAAGHGPGLIGDGRAMAICKDMDFAGTIRSDARHGIRLMITPANDFGRDGWIHARMAVMRGVENGFALLRSAFNGLETVSDAKGRILVSAGTSRHGMIVVTADVPLGPGPTLYTLIGDVFAWLCIAAVFGLTASMAWMRFRLR